MAECVGKWCVELSIPSPPRRSLQSACFTSHPVCFYRSLFLNGIKTPSCILVIYVVKSSYLVPSETRKTDNQWQRKRKGAKVRWTVKDRNGYININRGVEHWERRSREERKMYRNSNCSTTASSSKGKGSCWKKSRKGGSWISIWEENKEKKVFWTCTGQVIKW